MSEDNDPTPAPEAPQFETPQSDAVPPPPPARARPVPAYPAVPAFGTAGPAGKVRNTGTCILLTIVTLGFYTWYWYYSTHEDMKRHTGTGIGGVVALILAIFVGVVM